MTYRRWRCGSTAAATREDGVARSTTSVAMVYAVTVETGLNREDIGKLILTACFVTDLGTVLALRCRRFRYRVRSSIHCCAGRRRSCVKTDAISI